MRILLSESDDTQVEVEFGRSGLPVAADFDGDGLADFAVFSAGNWYVWRSSSGYLECDSFSFGLAGDIPVAGDFDGDGKADPGVWESAVAEAAVADAKRGKLQILLSGSEYRPVEIEFEGADGMPIAVDFDGDGICDFAVVQDGIWSVLISTLNYMPLSPVSFNSCGYRLLNADHP